MSIYLSNASGAVELVNTLIAELEALSSILDATSAQIRIDAIFGIELRKTLRVSTSAPIPVEVLLGADATKCAKEILTSIWLKRDQSAKETLRAPGAIALPRLALERIETTNRIRGELFDLVSLLKPSERKALWRKFPAISSLQALRTTVMLTDPQFITFYWHVGTSGTKTQAKTLIEEWDMHLTKLHGSRPRIEETLEGSLERKLVFALDMLELLTNTNEQVSIHRPVAPHIRARFKDGDHRPEIVVAPTPFVYDIDSPPPQIKALNGYCPSTVDEASRENKHRSSRAKLMEEPYIESMNIYRYMEAHREFKSVVKTSKKRNQRTAPSA